MKFVLFGSTGDLARLKILSALADLEKSGELPPDFELIAVGRRDYSTSEFLDFLKTTKMNPLQKDLSKLNPKYLKVDFESTGGFDALWEEMNGYTGDINIFLSLGYEIVELTLERFLDNSSKEFIGSHSVGVSVEKPFGGSYDQACEFNRKLEGLVGDENIYRNDHVVFKQPVLALDEDPEADAALLELMYGATKMRIVYAERIPVGDRVGFFEGKGISMDMLQSHLLQIAAMSLHQCELNDLKQCKAKFIDALQLIPSSIVRGQYESYSETAEVDPTLMTETFLSVSFSSSLPEWKDTIFELISGKALDETFIKIHVEHGDPSSHAEICIQPCNGGAIDLPFADGKAYHRLLLAFMNKDQTHFVSLPEVEAQWKLTENVRAAMHDSKLIIYPDNTSWKSIKP